MGTPDPEHIEETASENEVIAMVLWKFFENERVAGLTDEEIISKWNEGAADEDKLETMADAEIVLMLAKHLDRSAESEK